MESENEQITPTRYSDSRILIGNWNEENFTKEVRRTILLILNQEIEEKYFVLKEKFRKFLLKRERGHLISQQTSQIFSHFLKEVQLEVPCDFIRFGAVIQLEAPDMPKIDSMEDQSLVVSIAMDGITVNQFQRISSSCILSLAPSLGSCVRNSFIITR